MKLPDYLKCVQIKNLLVSMGIEKIPELTPEAFTRTRSETKTTQIDNPQITFATKLKLNTVSITPENITISSDETIEINGIKACAYIKNQRMGIDPTNKTSSYRFHLCNCGTIQSMVAQGRKHRYVSTTRDDEYFEVIDQSGLYAEPITLKLQLCKNCESILKSHNMYPEPFSLKKFFKLYQPVIPPKILRTEQVLIEEQYAPNHGEIAQKYKAQSNFSCQNCGLNCKENHSLLHLHHIDGNGQNNHASNLQVLCVDCHTHAPRHNHMLNNPQFLREIQQIRQLRMQQGIVDVQVEHEQP